MLRDGFDMTANLNIDMFYTIIEIQWKQYLIIPQSWSSQLIEGLIEMTPSQCVYFIFNNPGSENLHYKHAKMIKTCLSIVDPFIIRGYWNKIHNIIQIPSDNIIIGCCFWRQGLYFRVYIYLYIIGVLIYFQMLCVSI